jgi:hypothetical protein
MTICIIINYKYKKAQTISRILRWYLRIIVWVYLILVYLYPSNIFACLISLVQKRFNSYFLLLNKELCNVFRHFSINPSFGGSMFIKSGV